MAFGIQSSLEFEHVGKLFWVNIIIREVDQQSINIQLHSANILFLFYNVLCLYFLQKSTRLIVPWAK